MPKKLSQNDRILDILWDEKPHNTFELFKNTRIWRISARIYDLKQKGYHIESWQDKKNAQKHWYQLIGVKRLTRT